MSLRRVRLAAALAAVAAGLAVASCEVPLAPILPSDYHFTLSGYLDASADTQWVRVEPVSRTTDPIPTEIDAAVTLVDLASGAETTLRQEVRFMNNGPAHLFWTTAAVVPGGRYRLRAEGADGAATTTDIEVPAADAFTVEVQTGPKTCPTTVIVSGAEHLVDVQARYVLDRGGRRTEHRFSHADSFHRQDDGSIRATIYYGEDAIRMNLDPLDRDVVSSDVIVAVSTAAWPDPFGLSIEDLLQARGIGVENGLGFVGGVVTERHPFVPGIIEIGFGVEIRPCLPS